MNKKQNRKKHFFAKDLEWFVDKDYEWPKGYKLMPGEIQLKVIPCGLENTRNSFAMSMASAYTEFKGEVLKITKNAYLFKRIYVCCDDGGGVLSEGKEDHVWIFDKQLLVNEGIKEGDKISFDAVAYAYVRKNGTIDYGLRDLSHIEILSSDYQLPSDEELFRQFLRDLRCEVCLYGEKCDRLNCVMY